MIFREMPKIYDDQPIYGASAEAFTFIITQDGPNEFTASAKVKGATPFDNTRHDLGGFAAHKTFDEAKAACEKFLKERH